MITISNDNDVKKLTGYQIAVIQRIFDQFSIKEPVYIFETIHGHIARFDYKEGSFIPFQKNTPQRLNSDSLVFWSEIGKDLRWFEIGTGVIQVGLKL